jgi:lipopolysaccharide transport system ATP-binding protein
MSDAIITVENLGKRYQLGQRSNARYTALRDVLTEKAQGLFRRGQNGKRDRVDNEIWALRDVSFEVKRGEVIGIIGRNGAGKSTLLKILSRITEPTTGRVRLRGRVASLLEVGTGFHPELTGRENIYLNGAILGMTRAEIRRKFDEIVNFAEIEKFLDTPVKRYSSGMYVRLAFAVAAHLEPEILVVDEVLAVGDAEFQKKCLGKMSEVAQSGRTVLFVSHSMAAINRLCSRSVWLDQGRIAADGVTQEITTKYLSAAGSNSGIMEWPQGYSNPGVNELRVWSVAVVNDRGECNAMLDSSRPFAVEITYSICEPLAFCRIGFLLTTLDSQPVFEVYDVDDATQGGRRVPGKFVAHCEVPGRLLNAGSYRVSLNAGIPWVKNLAYLEGVLEITIQDFSSSTAAMRISRSGVINPETKWSLRTLSG